MRLKSLELSGFKSFAKKSLLEFASPIAGIVGPNGSGKSNVAEAFRFVLGEQSIKSMRGKRGEDLIFNGSKAVPRGNRAAVKVVFDNANRTLPVDFDEVAIERIVYRDSSNEYFINGSQTRLKDIIELLAGVHIGASGHHIISQGEADRILTVNTKERKAMLEDALGLKIYQYKKEEARRRLGKTEENIASVESLRREIQPHLKFLRRQVEKIEKAKALREELVGLYKEYFKREELYLARERALLAAALREPSAEMARLETELAKARQVVAEKKHGAESQGLLSVEAELKSARTASDSLRRELGRIEGEIFGVEKSLKLERDAAERGGDETISFRAVEGLASSLRSDLDAAEQAEDVQTVRGFIRKAREKISDFLSANRGSADPVRKAAAERSEAELLRLGEEKQRLEAAIAEASARETRLSGEYQALKDAIEAERDSERDAEKDMFRIVARQNEIRITLNDLRAREESLNMAESQFMQEQTEAGVLAGREAVDFASISIDEGAAAAESRMIQEDRRKHIERIKIRLEDQGLGGIDEVMKEYEETTERDGFLGRELEDLQKSAADLLSLISELEAKLDEEFSEGIRKINARFQEFFAAMFGGGSAELALVREAKRRNDTDLDLEAAPSEEASEEQGTEGIDIKVNLPHKKTKGLMMLSGGERALTSIALLFAMSQVNPPPFIILDETDAALDEANSRKYAEMVRELSKHSQLILITHNRETMAAAGLLYGVTMGSDGASKILSVAFEEAVKVAK
jgi:chromosome segregation protein